MSNFQLPILSQEAGLLEYLEKIKKFPLLSEEEELELAWRWYKEHDIVAAQKLVTSHLRLVAKIAMQYRGYGLPVADMISEGNIGLMTAVKKFDPQTGNRLSTYAMWWIKATIQEYVLKSWSIVRIGTSAAHKKLFFNLRKIKSKIFNANNGSIPHDEVQQIANALNVSEQDAKEMNERFSVYEGSLNDNAYSDDGSNVEIIDTIADEKQNHEQTILDNNERSYKKNLLNKALMKLDDRERDILLSRRMMDEPINLSDLGRKYKISSERVRQIEERAFQKLQNNVIANV